MAGVDPINRCHALLAGSEQEGERVSRLAHALQCATNAERAGAPHALVAACLVHDVGWALREADPSLEQDERRESHAAIGERFLAPWFRPEVTRPVGLHVDAKRYLCAVEADYRKRLSGASVHTLSLQGEPFSPAEAAAFIALPFAAEAVALRRFDEDAKCPHARTPPFSHFVPFLEAGLR